MPLHKSNTVQGIAVRMHEMAHTESINLSVSGGKIPVVCLFRRNNLRILHSHGTVINITNKSKLKKTTVVTQNENHRKKSGILHEDRKASEPETLLK